MSSPNQPKPTGFTETVTAQIGAERRQFQAFVPSPLPPSDLDISANAHREYDDNFASLSDLAAASPDRGYAVNRLTRAREAAASCNIENIDVTPYDILKAPFISTQPALPISQGINCLYAINELCQEDLTIKTINASHHTLMTNDPEFPTANIGTFRESQIFITNNGGIIHCMAPQRRVHRLMADLEEWIHSIHYRESSLFARLALTHYQFETIHPYDDGNGRIGRAISCAIAASASPPTVSVPFSHSVNINANRADYYTGLAAVRANNDWEPYLASMFIAMLNDLLTNHHIMSAINELRLTWHTQLSDNDTLRQAANLLLANPFTTTIRISEAFDISRSKAQDLLEELEAAQVIEPIDHDAHLPIWQAPQVMNIAHIHPPISSKL